MLCCVKCWLAYLHDSSARSLLLLIVGATKLFTSVTIELLQGGAINRFSAYVRYEN